MFYLVGNSLASTEKSGGNSSGRFATSTPISDCLETVCIKDFFIKDSDDFFDSLVFRYIQI